MQKVIHYLINQKGVYHLDIKPGNFHFKKINEDFVFRVIDFGHSYTEQNNLVSFQHFILVFRLKKYRFTNLFFNDTKLSKYCSEEK